jgi:hypothetical protein
MLCITAIFGIALRLNGLGETSLWYDEAAIWHIANLPLGELIKVNAESNSTPPTYPLLIKLTSAVWGNSEFGLRLTSAIAGSLGILAIAVVARQWVSWTGALFAAALMAFAPTQRYYSHEVREYSITVLVMVLLVLVWHTNIMRRNSFAHMVAYTAVACLALTLQYGLWVAVGLAHVMVIASVLRRPTRLGIVRLVSSTMVILIAATIVFLTSAKTLLSGGNVSFWYLDAFYLSASDHNFAGAARFLFDNARSFLSFLLFDRLEGTAVTAVLVISGAVWLAWKRHHILLAYAGLLLSGVILLACLRLYPFGGVRQDIFLTPVLYIFMAAGLEGLVRMFSRGRTPILRTASTFLVVAPILLVGAMNWRLHASDYWPNNGENIRPLLQNLAANVQSGDSIYVYWGAIPAFQYYWDSRSTGVGHSRVEVVLGTIGATDPDAYEAEIEPLLSRSRRVWIVFSHVHDSTLSDQRVVMPLLRARASEVEHLAPSVGVVLSDEYADPSVYLMQGSPDSADVQAGIPSQ